MRIHADPDPKYWFFIDIIYMIIYRKVTMQGKWAFFIKFLGFFWYWILFCLDPDPYRFCLDLDPYQSSVWIRIRNEIFQILDPDSFQYDTDTQHCSRSWKLKYSNVILPVLPALLSGYFVGPQFPMRKYKEFIQPTYQQSLPESPVRWESC